MKKILIFGILVLILFSGCINNKELNIIVNESETIIESYNYNKTIDETFFNCNVTIYEFRIETKSYVNKGTREINNCYKKDTEK